MVVMQLIEHLGQFQYLGNMTEILLVLHYQNTKPSSVQENVHLKRAEDQLLTAQPIPGFLIPPEDNERVSALLDTIFDEKIGAKTIEQILNGL